MRKIQVTDASAVSLDVDDKGALHLQITEQYVPNPQTGATRSIDPVVFDDGGEAGFNAMGLAENLRPKPLARSVPVLDLFVAWRAARDVENQAAQAAKAPAVTARTPLEQMSKASSKTFEALVEVWFEELQVPREKLEQMLNQALEQGWNAALRTKGAKRYSAF